MTFDTEVDQSVNESFRAVLILTGSVEVAERTVTVAIGNGGLDHSPNALIKESIRAAFWHTAGVRKLSPALPRELQALSLLSPIPRYCFVLRFLVGLDVGTCSEILNVSSQEVDEALCRALLNMPRALEVFRCSLATPNTN